MARPSSTQQRLSTSGGNTQWWKNGALPPLSGTRQAFLFSLPVTLCRKLQPKRLVQNKKQDTQIGSSGIQGHPQCCREFQLQRAWDPTSKRKIKTNHSEKGYSIMVNDLFNRWWTNHKNIIGTSTKHSAEGNSEWTDRSEHRANTVGS